MSIEEEAALILRDIREMTSAGGSWAIDQLPDLAGEWVALGRFEVGMTIGIYVLIIVASAICVKKGAALMRESNDNGDEVGMSWVIPGGVIGVFVLLLLCLTLTNHMTPWVAPKVYIVEQAARILP